MLCRDSVFDGDWEEQVLVSSLTATLLPFLLGPASTQCTLPFALWCGCGVGCGWCDGVDGVMVVALERSAIHRCLGQTLVRTNSRCVGQAEEMLSWSHALDFDSYQDTWCFPHQLAKQKNPIDLRKDDAG